MERAAFWLSMALHGVLSGLLVYAAAGLLTADGASGGSSIACPGGWAEGLPTSFVRATVANATASEITVELRSSDPGQGDDPSDVAAFSLAAGATADLVLRDPGRGRTAVIISDGKIRLVGLEIAHGAELSGTASRPAVYSETLG